MTPEQIQQARSKYGIKTATSTNDKSGYTQSVASNLQSRWGAKPKTQTALERLSSPEFKQQQQQNLETIGGFVTGAAKEIGTSLANPISTLASYPAGAIRYGAKAIGLKEGTPQSYSEEVGAARDIYKDKLGVTARDLSKPEERKKFGGDIIKAGVTGATLANPAMGVLKGAGMGAAYGTGEVLAEGKTGADAGMTLGVNTLIGGALGPIGSSAKAGIKTAAEKRLIQGMKGKMPESVSPEAAQVAYDEVTTKLKENVKNKIFGTSMALKNTRSAMELNKDVLAEDVVSKYAGKYGLPESVINPVTKKGSYRTVSQIKNVEKDLGKQEDLLLSRLAQDTTEADRGMLYAELKDVLDNSEYANNSSVYMDFIEKGKKQIDSMFNLNKSRTGKDKLKLDALNKEKSAQYNNSTEWGTRPGQQQDADLASLLGRTYKRYIEKNSKVPGIKESNEKIGELIDYKTILKQIDNKPVPTSVDALGQISDSSTNPYLAGALTYGLTGDTVSSAVAGAGSNIAKNWLTKRAIEKQLAEPLLNKHEKELLEAAYKKINSKIQVQSLTPDATNIPIKDGRTKLPVTNLQTKPRPVPVDGKVKTPVDVPFKSVSEANQIPVERVPGKGDVVITPDKDLPSIEFGPFKSAKGKALRDAINKRTVGAAVLTAGAGATGASAKATPKEIEQVAKATEDLAMSEDFEQKYPGVDRNYIYTLVEQESSKGTNDKNRKLSAGKYGWTVGFTKGTFNDILKKSATSDRYKNLLADMGGEKTLDTPEGAVKAALAYSNFLARDFSKERTTGNREYKKLTPAQLYKIYNGGGHPNAEKLFEAKYKNYIDRK